MDINGVIIKFLKIYPNKYRIYYDSIKLDNENIFFD